MLQQPHPLACSRPSLALLAAPLLSRLALLGHAPIVAIGRLVARALRGSRRAANLCLCGLLRRGRVCPSFCDRVVSGTGSQPVAWLVKGAGHDILVILFRPAAVLFIARLQGHNERVER